MPAWVTWVWHANDSIVDEIIRVSSEIVLQYAIRFRFWKRFCPGPGKDVVRRSPCGREKTEGKYYCSAEVIGWLKYSVMFHLYSC